MIKHTLSSQAQDDLKGIYIYSIENFGLRQAEIYKAVLTEQFATLCNNPGIGRDYSHIKGGLRRFVFRSHSIYYKIEDDFILILRILGYKQDPARHLDSSF